MTRRALGREFTCYPLVNLICIHLVQGIPVKLYTPHAFCPLAPRGSSVRPFLILLFLSLFVVSRWCWCGLVAIPSRLFTLSWTRLLSSSPFVDCSRYLWTWPSYYRFTSTATTLRSQHRTPHTQPVQRHSEAHSGDGYRSTLLWSLPLQLLLPLVNTTLMSWKQKREEG